jgi:hypothetical protein
MHSEILKQKEELENDIAILQNCSNILLSSSEGPGPLEAMVKLDTFIAEKEKKLQKMKKSLKQWEVLEKEKMTSRK